MKKFNLSQTKAEAAGVIVDAYLTQKRTGYTRYIYLSESKAEIWQTSFAANSDYDDHLIDTIEQWSLGDWTGLSGSALRSALIKWFVFEIEQYDRFELWIDDQIIPTTLYFLDDRYEVKRVSGGYRFQPIGWDGGTFSGVYKTKDEAWYGALNWDYQNDQIGFDD